LKKKEFWFRILNEATNINSFRFLYEATGRCCSLKVKMSYGAKIECRIPIFPFPCYTMNFKKQGF